jgi:hypothetical protein
VAAKHNHDENVVAGASAPTANPAEASVGRIDADEIAAIVEAAEKPQPAKPKPAPAAPKVAPRNDLERSGRSNTVVETQTVVEDRTDEPARKLGFYYEVEEKELDNGTILTSYGDVKGDA